MEVGANERSWHVNEPLGSFGQIRLPKIGRIWPKLPKTAVFRNMNSFPGCFFVTDGRLDVGVGANERSWRVYMSFGSFFQNRLPEAGRIWPKLPKTAVFLKISLYGLEPLN